MVKQLVRDSRGSDNREVARDNSLCKVYNGCLIFLDTGHLIELGKSLEAGHQLIRLVCSVLERIKLVLISHFKDV